MATLKYLLDVTAPDAKRTFDGIAARMTELDRNLQKTRELSVGDTQAMATFTRLQLQADRLKDRISSMPLTIDGAARAEAQLLGVEATADRMRSKLSGTGKTGFWSWITAGIPSLITSFGSLSGGFTGFISSMVSTGPIGIGVLVAIAAAVAGVAAALSTVVAALIPVTIGFVGFAALAIPTITKVWKAVQSGGKAWRDLTPAQKAVGDQIKGLQGDFGKLSKAIQPEVLKAFSDGLKIIRELMPAIRPLVIAAGKAIDAFLGSMSDWLKSPSGQAFIRWLRTDGPHDIKTFGQVMWDIASGIGVAFDHIYRTGVWLEGHLHTLFTIDIPAAWDILRNKVKLVWFQMELDAERFALGVTTTMGHLPGPLGAPFRTASADIRRSLAGIQQDVRNAEGQIETDWNKLHGKNIQFGFKFQVPGSVLGHKAIPGFAAGTGGAAPGWAWVGERGPELVRMHGGETVIPTHKISGYALGTDYTDKFAPAVPKFLAEFNAAFARTSNAMVNAMAAIGRSATASGNSFGAAGPGGGAPAANAALAARMFPNENFAAWNYVAMRESGWNQFALNPSSGAYGIAQALPPTKYPFAGQAAGGSNPAAQISWMEGYMRSVYGGAAGAAAHERAFNWYGSGFHGTVNRPTLFGAGERGRERVDITPGGQPQKIVLQYQGQRGGLEQALWNYMLKQVRVVGGGDVQVALGS